MKRKSGMFYVISGPAGAGKNAIIAKLLKSHKNMLYSISATTRPMRKGEINGVHYFFLAKDEFEKNIAENCFLEWARVNNCYYGTPRQFIMEKTAMGMDVITDMDVQGARRVKHILPETILIFIIPPSYYLLEKRLKQRKTEDAATIEQRLQIAREEIKAAREYDYLVINDKLSLAVKQIKSIMFTERYKTERYDMERLIKDFYSSGIDMD
ncbi:MAG: guanylate kinase [Bacillota bacterium]